MEKRNRQQDFLFPHEPKEKSAHHRTMHEMIHVYYSSHNIYKEVKMNKNDSVE